MKHYQNQRFKERCDVCHHYSDNFWTTQAEDDGDYIICNECFQKGLTPETIDKKKVES